LKVSLTAQPVDKVSAQTLVITHFVGDVPLIGPAGLIDWRLNGRLSRVILGGRFSGRAKELMLLPAEGRFKAADVVWLGLGVKESFDEAHIPQVFEFVIDVIIKKKASQVALSLTQMMGGPFDWRSAVALLVGRLQSERTLKELILSEPEDCIRDAKKRRLELGTGVQVNFD
jgi:hypothetical protein